MAAIDGGAHPEAEPKQNVSEPFPNQDGQSSTDDIDKLERKTLELEKEIKRLSTQVIQISAEKDAYEKHAKHLGETLKQVRKSAAEHHIKGSELGVDFSERLSLSREDVENAMESVKGEEHPHLEAVKLSARENGWLVNTEDVKLGKKIGEGATADIFLGEWHGLEVAVKCIRQTYLKSDEHALDSFLQEVELLVRQRHPYILRLFGASLEYPAGCWLITELLPRGTLTEWLHGEKGRQWNRKIALPPLRDRIQMGLEVALGMQYLHEQTPRVIHRDLKPSNIFIDKSYHVRVADFGFARILKPNEKVMTGETGTYMYMAPEVIRHDHYNETCDVFSFGVMFNELLTGQPPFIETFLTPMQMAVGVADGSMRPKLPHNVDSHLISLVTSCWAQDKSKRPSFAEISSLLKTHLVSMLKKESDTAVKDHKGGFFSFMHHA